jgi:hypothetical protein
LSWDQRFSEPIELPNGKKLVTLRDAAEYITKLPKAEHDANEWLAAMEALLLVAEHDGPTMFACIGMMALLLVAESGFSMNSSRSSKTSGETTGRHCRPARPAARPWPEDRPAGEPSARLYSGVARSGIRCSGPAQKMNGRGAPPPPSRVRIPNRCFADGIEDGTR